jgi:predicted phage terminase large subunit-like protein
VLVRKSDFTWAGKRGVIAIDPAATAKTSGDYSVLLVCAMEGFGIRSRMWIVDCVRVQEETPKVVVIAARLQRQYRLMIACETVGNMRAVPQSLRYMDASLRVMDIEIGGKDKFTRAQAVSGAWNDGRVLVPIDAPWADALIDEHKKFTGTGIDAHDDQVDADAHGWNVLYRTAPRITERDYAESSV